jgi:RNA polymerase sigma-70 factor (ECF subfamily)
MYVLRSPVWMMKSGACGSALILSTVACSVPTTSGFAGLLKPIWLSLICTKVISPLGSPVCPGLPNARELSRPPPTVQTTPVPAQAMHSRNPRRSDSVVVAIVKNEFGHLALHSPQLKLVLFEQIMVPHMHAAYNLARWLTRNEHDAEDVVQEAYLRAFRFFDSFQGGDGKAWLLAVVRNTCLTWRRREQSIAKVQFDEEVHHSGMHAASAESALVQEANLGSVRGCLELLPPDFREVLVMRELEEMPYKEISESTSLPIGTVMSRLSRARRRLQDCVAGRIKGAPS